MKLKEREKVSWFLVFMYFLLIILNAVWYISGDHIKIATDHVKYVKSFGEALYFSIVTITTLGYGEMHPVSSLGRIMVSLEAMSGVVLLGIFLINISLTVVEDKERKRINTLKLSFKEQYKIWRENTIDALYNLTNREEDINIETLYDLHDFRAYFKKDNSRYWYKVANNLSSDNYQNIFYTKELLSEIEFLQKNIETFIMQVPIEDVASLNMLNRHINGLYKMRKYDLTEHDERKKFMRILWGLVALWDFNSGEYGQNHLLDTIESI